MLFRDVSGLSEKWRKIVDEKYEYFGDYVVKCDIDLWWKNIGLDDLRKCDNGVLVDDKVDDTVDDDDLINNSIDVFKRKLIDVNIPTFEGIHNTMIRLEIKRKFIEVFLKEYEEVYERVEGGRRGMYDSGTLRGMLM
jgi:hypothetical protein